MRGLVSYLSLAGLFFTMMGGMYINTGVSAVLFALALVTDNLPDNHFLLLSVFVTFPASVAIDIAVLAIQSYWGASSTAFSAVCLIIVVILKIAITVLALVNLLPRGFNAAPLGTISGNVTSSSSSSSNKTSAPISAPVQQQQQQQQQQPQQAEPAALQQPQHSHYENNEPAYQEKDVEASYHSSESV
ncbi:hypothetical protein H696_03180 [Fonticula alba]|uniref:Uncharacterized protein n=1 Tax=Fonticula alba TaxID=691883 RepID=A0A058ZA56_FONAL|nr:hypothetical protein H696_03180 [Fonticula alba]KCV70823.1 hypothetical protein H696_03180 [Fonticula alba]|eukprot:XP_009495339.1 hypothetical protein H696_03180 [Fonticula alba]